MTADCLLHIFWPAERGLEAEHGRVSYFAGVRLRWVLCHRRSAPCHECMRRAQMDHAVIGRTGHSLLSIERRNQTH